MRQARSRLQDHKGGRKMHKHAPTCGVQFPTVKIDRWDATVVDWTSTATQQPLFHAVQNLTSFSPDYDEK